MSKRKPSRDPAPPATVVTGPDRRCPCGLEASYADCCGRFHSGVAWAPTAERLMRSRYSAFVVQDGEYLLLTSHSATRPTQVGFDADQHWTWLDVLAVTGGGVLEPTGTVEFRAHYTRRGEPGSQYEVSRFARESGHWVYVGD
jgi:SEC-C motif-containing protein